MAPVGQENRTKKVAECSCPEVTEERDTIKTTSEGNYLAAELRNKTAKE